MTLAANYCTPAHQPFLDLVTGLNFIEVFFFVASSPMLRVRLLYPCVVTIRPRMLRNIVNIWFLVLVAAVTALVCPGVL